jgi:hypothetical protein
MHTPNLRLTQCSAGFEADMREKNRELQSVAGGQNERDHDMETRQARSTGKYAGAY